MFTYTVTTKVPLDATAFTITDTLVDELEFANADETKVTIGGTALTAEELEAQVTREEQTLTVKLTEARRGAGSPGNPGRTDPDRKTHRSAGESRWGQGSSSNLPGKDPGKCKIGYVRE